VRLLWIATKPPWPPIDGGRLVQELTLRALRDAGVEVSLVAPVAAGEAAECSQRLAGLCTPHLVELPAAGLGRLGVAALRPGMPLTVARHRQPAVAERVAEVLAAGRFDVVHAEQLQALPQAPADRDGPPVVLRAQNVESDLWLQAARHAGLARPAVRWEARRLAAWEGRAVRRVAAAVALTARDAARLRDLAGAGARVTAVPAPFPARLPVGPEPLPGAPAVVLLGSGSWPPNRDAERWFVRRAWPAVLARLPAAVLHCFGGVDGPEGPSVRRHLPPADAARVFAPRSVQAVPLRIASGVRIKILEAWARGVPVVATPEGAAGLEAEDGRELLIAERADGFAAALERLARSPELGASLTEAGRRLLAAAHRPERVAGSLLEVYRHAAPPV